jgi:hypothetical protein
MHQIERAIASIREDRRSDYMWDTAEAANVLSVHPNKFHAWWYRTREKLIELFIADPGNTATELLSIIAAGEAERQRRMQCPSTSVHCGKRDEPRTSSTPARRLGP